MTDQRNLFECIQTIITEKFDSPDIITFTEVVNTKWISDHFEKETEYWGVIVTFERGLKIYTAWKKNKFKLHRVIQCFDGRYVCFLLEHLEYKTLIWYVSIHGHKKDVRMRRLALLNLVEFCKDAVAIVAGDFNDNPDTLHVSLTGIPYAQQAIKSSKVHTTRRKNSIDNSLSFKATYTAVQVGHSIDDFSHFPIKYTVNLDSTFR